MCLWAAGSCMVRIDELENIQEVLLVCESSK